MDKSQKIKRIIQLLTLAKSTQDQEVMRSIIESIIEMLEEENNW